MILSSRIPALAVPSRHRVSGGFLFFNYGIYLFPVKVSGERFVDDTLLLAYAPRFLNQYGSRESGGKTLILQHRRGTNMRIYLYGSTSHVLPRKERECRSELSSLDS